MAMAAILAEAPRAASLHSIRKHVRANFCGKTDYSDPRLKHALARLQGKGKIKKKRQSYLIVKQKASSSRTSRRRSAPSSGSGRRSAPSSGSSRHSASSSGSSRRSMPSSGSSNDLGAYESELQVARDALSEKMKTDIGMRAQLLGDEYDTFLCDVDTSANRLRFHHLCVVEYNGGYFTAFQYGRIGTAGTINITGPMSQDEAKASYQKKFREKSAKYELMRRIASAGGKWGCLNVCLMWDNGQQKNDLDIHVKAPSSEEIYFAHMRSKCGGCLDVDRMQDVSKGIENIVWQNDPPVGTYKVFVKDFSNNGKGMNKPFDVFVRSDSMEKKFACTMPFRAAAKHKMHITDFHFDGSRITF